VVANRLATSAAEVDAAVRGVGAHHEMKVAWVTTTADGAIEVGLRRRALFDAGGIIVVLRWTNGGWAEDAGSEQTWQGDSSPPPAPPRLSDG
jgi:hypothetical protein